MSVGELGCIYASLILHDDGISITSDKISTLVQAANVEVESYWPSLFAKLVQTRSVQDLVMNVGSGGGAAPAASIAACAAPAAEEKKEEKKEELKEESEDDMGFSLFD